MVYKEKWRNPRWWISALELEEAQTTVVRRLINTNPRLKVNRAEFLSRSLEMF